MTIEQVIVTVAVGFCVGILAALFGVGGGLLMVPFMVLFLDKGQHLAEGTSLAVIVPTAIVGVIAHARRGFVSLRSAALLAVGGIGGAVGGAFLALSLSGVVLQMVFGAVVIAIGTRFVFQGLQARSSGTSTLTS